MNKLKLTVGGLVVGLVLFLAFNLIVSGTLRHARLDVTEERLFTLSQGTQNILESIKEPITFTLYFSEERADQLKSHGQRVRELLEEYELRSGGKITLKVIDPEPFSEDEERAQQAGLASAPVGSGDSIFFGLVATNSTDAQETIPFFDPRMERSLEYDLTRLVHTLDNPKRPVVGLLSGLEIEGSFNPMMGMRGQTPPWILVSQMRELFDVRTLESSLDSIEQDIQVLMVVHPKGLPAQAQYAVDQFVLRGGHALVLVDPFCEADEPKNDPMNPMAAMGAVRNSDLGPLFQAWGLELAPGQVASDRSFGLQVQVPGRNGKVEELTNVVWLGIDERGFDPDDSVIAGLKSINVASAGVLRKVEGASTSFTPLLSTSQDSSTVEASSMPNFPDGGEAYKRMAARFSPSGQVQVLAARISGNVNSAFPGGRPVPLEEGAVASEHLASSSAPINVIVIADCDMLQDRFWVQEERLGPISLGYRKFADNGDFVTNALDNLSGSNDLISVRGRGEYQRPFEEVRKLQALAQQRNQAKSDELEQKLADARSRIEELQRETGDDDSLILTPELMAERDRYQQEELETIREMRAVEHDLNRDIDSLGTRLKLINIALVPLLVAAFAVALGSVRMRRRHSK